jgi:hypothetical protein
MRSSPRPELEYRVDKPAKSLPRKRLQMDPGGWIYTHSRTGASAYSLPRVAVNDGELATRLLRDLPRDCLAKVSVESRVATLVKAV